MKTKMNVMKIGLLFLVGMMGGMMLFGQQTKDDVINGLRLQATMQGSGRYIPWVPIYAEVRIRNITAEPILLPHPWGPEMEKHKKLRYWVVTLSSDGKERVVIGAGRSFIGTPVLGRKPVRLTLGPGQERGMTLDVQLCKVLQPGSYRLIIELNISPWDKGGWEGHWRAELSFEVIEPTGIDAEAKRALDHFWKKVTPEGRCRSRVWKIMFREAGVLSRFPSSTYAGWVLWKWRPDLPGAFVKIPSAKEAINAVINRDHDGLKLHWRLDITPKRDKQRTGDMNTLVSATKAFVRAHSDFPFAGYLLARAGFNALGLQRYDDACAMLSEALTLQWRHPTVEGGLKANREGTEYALTLLQEEGICSKELDGLNRLPPVPGPAETLQRK